MTLWDQALGALVAGVVAWAAIAVFALGAQGRLRTGPLRWFGAAALASLALVVAGLPVPAWTPLGLLGVGVVAAVRPGGTES